MIGRSSLEAGPVATALRGLQNLRESFCNHVDVQLTDLVVVLRMGRLSEEAVMPSTLHKAHYRVAVQMERMSELASRLKDIGVALQSPMRRSPSQPDHKLVPSHLRAVAQHRRNDLVLTSLKRQSLRPL
jgi:hypothetical protein